MGGGAKRYVGLPPKLLAGGGGGGGGGGSGPPLFLRVCTGVFCNVNSMYSPPGVVWNGGAIMIMV